MNKRDFEEGSEVFKDMFALPAGEHAADGASADRPLVLEGVKADDMEFFLTLVYPPCVINSAA